MWWSWPYLLSSPDTCCVKAALFCGREKEWKTPSMPHKSTHHFVARGSPALWVGGLPLHRKALSDSFPANRPGRLCSPPDSCLPHAIKAQFLQSRCFSKQTLAWLRGLLPFLVLFPISFVIPLLPFVYLERGARRKQSFWSDCHRWGDRILPPEKFFGNWCQEVANCALLPVMVLMRLPQLDLPPSRRSSPQQGPTTAQRNYSPLQRSMHGEWCIDGAGQMLSLTEASDGGVRKPFCCKAPWAMQSHQWVQGSHAPSHLAFMGNRPWPQLGWKGIWLVGGQWLPAAASQPLWLQWLLMPSEAAGGRTRWCKLEKPPRSKGWWRVLAQRLLGICLR